MRAIRRQTTRDCDTDYEASTGADEGPVGLSLHIPTRTDDLFATGRDIIIRWLHSTTKTILGGQQVPNKR